MTRSEWWLIVAEHLGLRSDDTALLNARCWRWWPYAYSLDLICVEHVLLSGRIISRWCGYIVLRTRRVCCHSLQQFQFSIIHRPGKYHGNADGLSRAPSSPCGQCTRPDCPPATLIHHDSDQPFDSVSTGSSEDADLVPVTRHISSAQVADFTDAEGGG